MNKYVLLYCSCILLVFSSCSGESDAETKDNTKETSDIVVTATLESSGAVGYGNLYIAEVHEVSGVLDQPFFTLVVLTGDKLEKDIRTETVCSMRFRKHEENVERQLMPLTGFVDEHLTSWKLVSIEEEK